VRKRQDIKRVVSKKKQREKARGRREKNKER
jgi:hypothetical protein